MSFLGKTIFPLVIGVGFLFLSVAQADEHEKMEPQDSQSEMIMVVPADITWADVPPVLPPGAKIVVLEGNPFEPGLYSLRLQFPSGYEIPAHWHTMVERVTVISGTLMAGMGDKLDKEQSKAFPAGSFIVLPGKMHHFAWADGDTVVQINGEGPFDIHYIDSADDPRNMKAE